MSVSANKQLVARVFSEAFNQGDLAVIDEVVAATAVDHQHPAETSFADHLKDVVRAMRTAFPDLHFELTQIIGEDDWVATHSWMTGTNTGELRPPLLPPNGPPMVPPTGRPVRVAHMHLIRFEHGHNTELWHLMDSLALLGQLGILPAAQGAPAGSGRT